MTPENKPRSPGKNHHAAWQVPPCRVANVVFGSKIVFAFRRWNFVIASFCARIWMGGFSF